MRSIYGNSSAISVSFVVALIAISPTIARAQHQLILQGNDRLVILGRARATVTERFDNDLNLRLLCGLLNAADATAPAGNDTALPVPVGAK